MSQSVELFNLSEQASQNLFIQPPTPPSQFLSETEATPRLAQLKKKPIKRSRNLTLNKTKKRMDKNTIPNLIKKFFNKVCKDPQLYSRLSKLQDLQAEHKDGKNGLKILVNKKCCKTQLMKLLKILRNEFTLEVQRKEISSVLQKCVESSVEFKSSQLQKKPKEKDEIIKALKIYQKVKKLIQFFLFADSQTYILKVRELREDIFNPAEKDVIYNAGVKKIQQDKKLQNQKEIGNELRQEDPFSVLDLGPQKYL